MVATPRARVALGTALLFLALIPVGSARSQDNPTGAKTLFYNPATGTSVSSDQKKAPVQPATTKRRPVSRTRSAQTRYVGVHYWIELFGLGAATDKTIFRTGDRIRLHVRTNVDGYLTLWSFDPAGRGTLMLPAPGAEASAFIGVDSPYVTPVIRFSPPAEEERLALVFSRSKPDPVQLAGSPRGPADVVSNALGPAGARALVLEVEERERWEVGTYVVNKEGGAVATEIRLRHVAP